MIENALCILWHLWEKLMTLYFGFLREHNWNHNYMLMNWIGKETLIGYHCVLLDLISIPQSPAVSIVTQQ